jgi:ribosome-associated toxin RatA of RatAB toxin-antitoxin module
VTRNILVIGLLFLGAARPFGAAPQEPVISVSESDGRYAVAARFAVAEAPAVVREVLTDYANIPRFMPDVRRSVIVERDAQRVRVEQEAISKYMMFSKTVHLVLEVEEGDEVIAFRDQFNRSFEQYEGSWTLRAHGAGTLIEYQLTARPAFSVPGFVLRRLLNRDAVMMVERLRGEIRSRSVR